MKAGKAAKVSTRRLTTFTCPDQFTRLDAEQGNDDDAKVTIRQRTDDDEYRITAAE